MLRHTIAISGSSGKDEKPFAHSNMPQRQAIKTVFVMYDDSFVTQSPQKSFGRTSVLYPRE